MLEGWRYVRAADIGLSPIPRGPLLDVGSPTKVPEYLALGVPVVCNDNPDQRSILEASGCGICVPYTAQEFAKAVLQLLELDVSEKNCMQERGIIFVRNHRDYKKISSDVATIYLN
jgi:glycosyltransferase involved in cell wall biosynthesis